MKITKTQLKQIIKEELEASLAEAKLKDFIKTGKIHSSIPAGSLTRVLAQNPKLSLAHDKSIVWLTNFSSPGAPEKLG